MRAPKPPLSVWKAERAVLRVAVGFTFVLVTVTVSARDAMIAAKNSTATNTVLIQGEILIFIQLLSPARFH
jgi:hypothetical protein